MSVEKVRGGGVFLLRCFDADGALKWEGSCDNLVVNTGLQDMVAKYFTGTSYTAQFYLGIYGAGASNTPAAGDTMLAHPGWTENVSYSNPTRPAAVFGATTLADPAVISNAASTASFYMNATTTVGGAFLTTDNTKGGTAGMLFSAADFSVPGDRAVISGDTIQVIYTFSLSAL